MSATCLPDGGDSRDHKEENVVMLAELDRHARTTLSAAWDGSPNPRDPSNIRRICSCGQVIGQLPYPKPRPGRTVTFRLGGEQFDQPHREHIAKALVAHSRTLPGERP